MPTRTAVVLALGLGITVVWTWVGLRYFAIGPSDWDDAMYCDRAATGFVAWDIRNRYVHVWALRMFFALSPSRELGAQLYASLCVCSLGALALWVGHRIGGLRAGLVAMGSVLVFPPMLKYLTVPHVDLTLALWMSVATVAAAVASENEGRRMLAWAAVAGSATILALKSKETALVLLPVLAIVLCTTAARPSRALLGVAAGGSLTILILWLLHLWLDAPGSRYSSADFLDYFTKRPMSVPGFGTSQTPRPSKLRHDFLSQLTSSAALPIALLGLHGLMQGFKRNAIMRALTGLLFGIATFTAYIAYASPNIQVEDRYIIALALPLAVGVGYACRQLLVAKPGAEHWRHDGGSLMWLLPLLLILCVLSGRGLWVWADGGDGYRAQAAMVFLLPVTTVALFLTPFMTDNRWLPRVSAALLLLVAATASTRGALDHVARKTEELAPWRKLVAAADAGTGELAVTPGSYGHVRVGFRLRSLSRQPATRLKTRPIRKPTDVRPGELLVDGDSIDRGLQKAGYRVIASFRGERRGRKAWTAYRPPAGP